VAVWDADVIAPVNQIVKALELLRNGEADFVYPYEKQFLDTSPILRSLFIQKTEIEIFERNAQKMSEMYLPDPVGGGFMANLKVYKEAGLENENFYGWGPEDHERYHRWENFGCIIKRIPGPLFHLSHGRGINSTYHNKDIPLFNMKEIANVRRKNNIIGSQSSDEQIPINSL
jgi:predicted glycosyltransferase involved in capsule biosynthesis